VQQLGVLDAEHGTWLQNVPDVRGKNPAAFAETNHIFTIVQIPVGEREFRAASAAARDGRPE
jgi:hypothetical protein